MKRARTDTAKDARRLKLLEMALDEFYERGFAAARMEDIAKRAGLSKGTLYLYFDSKEALFTALVDSLARPNLAIVRQMMDSAPSFADAMSRLAQFAPMMIRESRLPKLMKVIVGDSQNFPDIVADYRSEVLEQLLGLLAHLLERSAAAGEIYIEDPLLTARLIVAPVALSGLWQAVFAQSGQDEIDLERLFRIHTEALLRGFAPREPAS